jgi:DNA-binding LacI/PurR family transcriptional regulator
MALVFIVEVSVFFNDEVRQAIFMTGRSRRRHLPAEPGRDRMTLQRVAAEVGVSAKTVSNAFTRPDQLSAATRERVLAAAARLGYAGPDPLAAGLRRGRVGALGFAYDHALSYAFDDPVAVAVLAGISSVAEQAGSGLLLVPGSAPAERNTAAVAGAVMDGLVVFSLADDDPLLGPVLARRLPFVVIDEPDPSALRGAAGGDGPPWIGIDDEAAAAEAAGHLLALGHRRLGVVSFGLSRRGLRCLADEAAQRDATYAVTRRRLAGYRDAVVRAGIDWSAVPVEAGGANRVEDGAAMAAALLARTPRPTALLCMSDRLAEGALRCARGLGLRVPGDLSVIGFDDGPGADAIKLSTVRQPHRRKGELAARALLDLVATGAAEPVQLLPAELIVRATTGPPP